MTTLREFEEALRSEGNEAALAILQTLKDRDKARRQSAPARRVTGKKMTPDLAHRILELHGATRMTQQEIAFKLGVNQGRVNEVIKRGKWLTDDPAAPEAVSRDRALERMAKARPAAPATARAASVPQAAPRTPRPAKAAPSQEARPSLMAAPSPDARPPDVAPASAKARPASRRPPARPPTPPAPSAQLSLGDF